MKIDQKKQANVYEQRIQKLKDNEKSFQDIINDYKSDLNHLTSFDDREQAVANLSQNIRDTHNLILNAEENMRVQEETIMPVLGLIHIAAKDPKWANTAT